MLLEKDMDQKSQVTQRVNEIIQVMNARQDLLEQFDDDIFNALVEKTTLTGAFYFCIEKWVGD
jgi:site-specific DNA recombinase